MCIRDRPSPQINQAALSTLIERLILQAATGVIGTSEAEITEAIGSPALLASARFYQGTAQISGRRSAAAAATYHREGIELARTAGAELVECQNLQGLLDAEVLLEAPTVRTVCIEAIERLYELRYWLYLWRVLDGAACVIARSGRCSPKASSTRCRSSRR